MKWERSRKPARIKRRRKLATKRELAAATVLIVAIVLTDAARGMQGYVMPLVTDAVAAIGGSTSVSLEADNLKPADRKPVTLSDTHLSRSSDSYLSTSSVSGVPEPSTLLLLGAAMPWLIRRRR